MAPCADQLDDLMVGRVQRPGKPYESISQGYVLARSRFQGQEALVILSDGDVERQGSRGTDFLFTQIA